MTPTLQRGRPLRGLGRTVLLVGSAAGLALAGTGPAVAAAPGAAGASATPRPSSVTVPLITGDWVRLTTAADGRQSAAVLPRDRHGVPGAFHTEFRNGDLYVIPALAEPYLGHGLDVALFDVSQLARAGLATPTSRLPIRLTYRTGAAQHALPGITVTRTQGSTADGYVTPASAGTFGGALAAQLRSDAAAHWPRDTGLFAGLTGLRYAGPAAPTPAQPLFPMVTLRITAVGMDGQPLPFGAPIVINTDDQRRYNGNPVIVDGETRISVPVGHYSVLLGVHDVDENNHGTLRLLNISDYPVTKAQSLALDLRSATVPVGANTPRPGVVDDGDLYWSRSDALGSTVDTVWEFGDGVDALVDPGPVSTGHVGTLHFSTRLHLSAPDTAAQPYTYDLRFDSPVGSVPRSLTYQVAPADLTTLDSRYHADGDRRDSVITRFSFLPWAMFGFQRFIPAPVPGERPEYVNDQPDVTWQAGVTGFRYTDFSTDFPVIIEAAAIDDALRRYQPGTELTVDWARPVLHPGFAVDTGLSPGFACPACRQGDSIAVLLAPVVDSVPGHVGGFDLAGPGTPFGPVDESARLRLYQDQVLLADQSGLATVADVPADSQPYRLVVDTTRTAPWYTQSTGTHTEWTFTSARPDTQTAPARWDCTLDGESSGTGPCAVLPLLSIGYDAPVDLTGRVPGGPNRLGITVAPSQNAPASTIASATVEVSFDDGTTWTTAALTGSNGHYAAAFTAPGNGFVSTRVTAADAGGDTVSQTVIRAYAVGGTG